MSTSEAGVGGSGGRTLLLGRREYRETLDLMQALVEQLQRDEVPDTLLLVEHPPVITVGRSRDAASQLTAPGEVPVVELQRGGGSTYHGPGQAVGYPVFRLRPPAALPVDFLRLLERVLVATLARYGVQAGVRAGLTGVWVGERKIASIGTAVRLGVTYHGFALNVRTELREFQRISPCGLDSAVMVNLAELTGGPGPSMEQVFAVLRSEMESAWGVALPVVGRRGDGEMGRWGERGSQETGL